MIDLQGKIFVTTFDETILAVPHSKDITSISPCTQEEADTRILLHVEDCAKEGLKKILIRTTDTDVLILAILCYQMADVKELWVGFGVGKHFKYIAAHEIATKLGTISVPCLYWIRCHIILFSKGKTTAWNTWAVFPEAVEAFITMRVFPLHENVTTILERFVVLMYDRTSES